jgi:hypothetical protein
MIRKLVCAAMILAAGLFAGCGGGGTSVHAPPPDVTVDIFSSGGVNDGDITYDPVLATYSLATNASFDNVFVGTEDNPLAPGDPFSFLERRGFLTFPITSIPTGSHIVQATATLRVLRMTPIGGSSVTVFPDLVVFPRLDSLTTQLLLGNAFDLLDRTVLLAGPSAPVSSANLPKDMFIDVTDALVSAGNRGFSTMQLRLIGTGGRIIIDDLSLPPVLTVTYH